MIYELSQRLSYIWLLKYLALFPLRKMLEIEFQSQNKLILSVHTSITILIHNTLNYIHIN